MRKKLFLLPCLAVALGLCACAISPQAPTNPIGRTTMPHPTQSEVTATPQPTATPPTPTATPTAAPTPTPTPTPLPTGYVGRSALQQPRIRIDKTRRELYLYDGDVLLGVFPVGLGFSPTGHKQVEGDGKTPEGTYYICTRNGQSRYALSLGLSYPNAQDARTALQQGSITQAQHDAICAAIARGARPPWDTPLGGAIMIHGCGAARDWTAGCVAVEDDVMDVLWQLCPIGTAVEIVP